MLAIGKAIKSARISAGLQQRELAIAVGITPVFLSYVENDRRQTSLSVIASIAEHLKTTPEALIINSVVPSKNDPRDYVRIIRTLQKLIGTMESAKRRRADAKRPAR